ncbi:hypothetical protein LCGC14_2789570 [marine sediment metagenome]|uniref:Xylose isomerase-like TIM barrel domain-containing protein n=1 Tax=marine sediment metagenome TaxID=412755 RepID=A0A0F9AZK2_9ZZZZ
MQLGIGSFTYCWAVGVPGKIPSGPMTADGLVDRAHDLGLGLVQLCDNLQLEKLSEHQLGELKEKSDDLGIKIEIGARGIKPEYLLGQLELAVRFNSPILRVVIDSAGHKPSPEEVVQLLGGMIGEFEKADVVIAIENHDRFTTLVFIEMIEEIGSSHVGICLDTVNSFGALEAPDVVVETLGRYVVNLHIKDFDIRRSDYSLGFVIEGTPAGKGRLDVPWLLEKLAGTGRDFNAILELWTPPERDIQATIAKEEAWAIQSIEYLRQVIPDCRN